MPLVKSKGNMYPWVTHMHVHLGGECPHGCSYCYVDSFRHRSGKYQGELRILDRELQVDYGEGKVIFVDHCNDLFAAEVPDHWITAVLLHCWRYPGNDYVLQTKNPKRALKILKHMFSDNGACVPRNFLVGTTIESNVWYDGIMGKAPAPVERISAIKGFQREGFRTFVTVEPVLDFDPVIFSKWIVEASPEFVNIGADSKGHKLPEPSAEKIGELVRVLTEAGIEIREKRNLERLIG